MSGGGAGQLSASAGAYLAAQGGNLPPPPITSDPLVAGMTPIEQLLRVLGLSANLGDPKDNTESIEEHAKRDSKTADAAAKFPAQDEQADAQMKGVAGQGADQMAQQLPQMASQLAGALAGAMGGALQPLAQIPQQLAQGAQQAMQAGMGMMQQAGGASAELDKASLTDPLGEFGETPGESGAGGGSAGGGGGGLGGTTPTAMLGPPPVPSAGTSPSAANTAVPPPRMAAPAPMTTGGMGGMPMIPPGAMHGAGGSEKDAKADTKRVSVPSVKNGAPVQGRITTPPPQPQVTKADGKPVATRRIIVPNSKADEEPARDPKS
ncbi:hypothetical protein FHT40_000100 [Mycolicibacterium sp. BK556]|uniref:hypothetical protein n=1 Tax=Mycobacteriaceae TaxID=1762 RepID=UPI00105C18DF|nr:MULTISPECIES: hypothetical protein [Mycobacteriaceae]MBB3600467.1 hypothetical protein [Mycolicibacterium sp. BK556]MBB3630219.1 hypothetical protein [Mycolicibacterium sp. BK607]MBB3748219.1 hypothetical protein [Mycolicibacterium sp. BK634]TDO10012.1 hypothetical protein EV580_4297 [Mycobacterium sp. BK086]